MDPRQSELELQQELERFTTQFADRVTQATEALEAAAAPAVRDEALRKNLRYVSSATEIATGPFAEVNLLDMIVFVRLSRAALEKHWIPELYGEAGAPLAEVFARSEEELDVLAAQILTPAQRAQLAHLVDTWLADNPDQVRVEGIRLSDFSTVAGTAAAERALEARGLLASMKTATQAANQALMLTERGMFLVHRLPFLWRMQARVGAREMMNDVTTQLQLARRGVIFMALFAAAGLVFWWLAWFTHR